MKKVMVNIGLIVSVLLFLGSAAALFRYFRQADETEEELQQLAKEVRQDTVTEKERVQAGEIGILARYVKLYKKNEDLAGWIRIPETQIDYPVMQRGEYYLHRNFQKEEDPNGLPFLDERCDMQNKSSNFLIYGHHMKSGMMFTALLDYKEPEFYKSHREIEFDTIRETGKYRVLSAYYTTADGEGKEPVFLKFAGSLDKAGFTEYVNDAKAKALYDTGETAQYGQTLLTLVTCSYHEEGGRFVLVCVKKGEGGDGDVLR